MQDELGLTMYDYGARNYDPALSRWMNIDPLAEKYNFVSPYAYVVNNPVIFIDPNGKEIFIPNIVGKNPNGVENARQKSTILTNLQKLTNSKLEMTKTRGGFLVREVKGEKVNEGKKLSQGTSLITGLIGADEKITIKLGGENRADRSKNGDTSVSFNPDAKGENISNADGTKGRPAEIGLAHELIHADENAKTDGAYDKTPVAIINPDGAYPGNKVEVQQDEINVRERENKIREEQKVTPRTTPKIVN
nr:RHS repeat-associated core domain-containing protein [Flavobacterium sp. fv08]